MLIFIVFSIVFWIYPNIIKASLFEDQKLVEKQKRKCEYWQKMKMKIIRETKKTKKCTCRRAIFFENDEMIDYISSK